MHRALLLCFLALLASPAAAEAASVKLIDCVPALEPVERTATFEARARAAGGSDRVQIRFTLQVREEGLIAWRKVVAEGFDSWLTSGAGVRRYTYARTIENLTAPAAYRTVVRFRWLDEEGEVLDRSRATSPACRQPDLRPDLEARRLDIAPGPTEDLRRYAITVANRGRSVAGPSSVALRAGEQDLEPLAVAALAAGEQRVVTFVGPACLVGAPLLVTMDSAAVVDERDEDDNVLAAACQP